MFNFMFSCTRVQFTLTPKWMSFVVATSRTTLGFFFLIVQTEATIFATRCYMFFVQLAQLHTSFHLSVYPLSVLMTCGRSLSQFERESPSGFLLSSSHSVSASLFYQLTTHACLYSWLPYSRTLHDSNKHCFFWSNLQFPEGIFENVWMRFYALCCVYPDNGVKGCFLYTCPFKKEVDLLLVGCAYES
jgi:hypothetical protein